MAIGIKIAENVTLTQPEISEYGGLNITFVQKADKPAEAPITGNVLDFMNQEVDTSASGFDQENRLTVYALKPTNYDGTTLTPEDFQKDNTAIREQLNLITNSYGLGNVDFKPFEGMTQPKAVEEVITEEVLEKVSTNYFNQFLKLMEKADLGKEFRVVFPRKSAKSKYPGLRKKLLKDFPFMESMEVPADKSKVKFTKYEISKGLDKELEVSADANTGGDVAALFGADTPADTELPFGA